MAQTHRIRYAVIGAGNIAQVAVMPAFAHAESSSELVAIVSGDPEKRTELCQKYQLQFQSDYDDLEALLKDASVDAVYIATPNALHREHALRAAAAGVHVLCEKPLATSVAECKEIQHACQRSGVKLMTAYRLHFEEGTLAAIDLIRRRELGEPRIFDSTFCHVVRPGDIRERADVGGGAALDLGVYCVNAARNLFEDEPTAVFATSVFAHGVDQTTTAILYFPGDRVAQFTVSNVVASVSSYRIACTEGDLRMEPAYDYTTDLVSYVTAGGKTSERTFARRDQFAPELEYFARCIRENVAPEPSVEEGLNDIRVVEGILASARARKLIELGPAAPIRRRPEPAQAALKPPVAKQKPIHASSPGVK